MPGHGERTMVCEQLIEISTTFASRSAADACARRLVEVRVAACVQVDGPVSSVYRWRSAVEIAEEWRCTCKTTPEREGECLAAITALHDYETPQLVVTAVATTPAYGAWVRASVSVS